MGWSIGFDDNWQRDIGYGVPAECDFPRCRVRINRGLAHVCGNEPYGGEKGCGLYFCHKHLQGQYQRCSRCANYKKKFFTPKPDVPMWIKWKLKDESWANWRKTPPGTVFMKEHGRPT